MTYLIILGVLAIAYFMYKAKSERQEFITKYGPLPIYLKKTIEDLKERYPNHVVKRESKEDIRIICYGSPRYTIILFFSWLPTGLALRVDYENILGRKFVKNFDFNPEYFDDSVLSDILDSIHY